MAVRVVTDSTCDLPADVVAQHQIIVVPAVLSLHGKSYLDGVDLSRSEFYKQLPQLDPLPTTAAPSTGAFEDAFRACGDDEVVCITLAGRLSAMYNAARLGAEQLGKRVTLIDSGNVSMALGWQVLAAAEAAAARIPLAGIVDKVRSVQRRVRLYAALDTVEYLRRGGRASRFTALLGELLQIKPLIEVRDGEVLALAKQRTRARVRESLAGLVEALGRLERLAVVHADCLEGAEALAARLAPRCAEPPIILEATSVVGTHAGPGAVGAAPLAAE